MMDQQTLPLSGIKVIDFTQVMLGPCATQTLGDFGAEVIKVERKGSGDLSRWAVEKRGNSDNPVFCSLNRNKRSIALDMRGDAGKALARDLIRDADVVVSNFRPGVMERLGLGYEDLSKDNPGLIWAFGSGFGSSGPYQHKGGQDVLAQAMSGVMARKADPDHPLAIYPTTLCDYSAGMHLVQGVLLALLAREKTGKGQKVEVSLYDSILAMQMQEASMEMAEGIELNWAAMPLSGVFETTDGAVVMVGAFKENPLRDICTALEIEDLSGKYPTLEVQRVHRRLLQATFRERFASNTTTHWIERLEGQDLLCSPVKTLTEALEDPQTHHNGMILEYANGGEPMRQIGQPVHLSDAEVAIRVPPPLLGEQTDQILREIGLDDARISSLRQDGVVA